METRTFTLNVENEKIKFSENNPVIGFAGEQEATVFNFELGAGWEDADDWDFQVIFQTSDGKTHISELCRPPLTCILPSNVMVGGTLTLQLQAKNGIFIKRTGICECTVKRGIELPMQFEYSSIDIRTPRIRKFELNPTGSPGPGTLVKVSSHTSVRICGAGDIPTGIILKVENGLEQDGRRISVATVQVGGFFEVKHNGSIWVGWMKISTVESTTIKRDDTYGRGALVLSGRNYRAGIIFF